jgi:two-component system sensor histidine kinase HydH
LIRDIREEADRVNRILTELLEYARPLSPERRPLRLSSLIDHACAKVYRLGADDGKEIRLRKAVPETIAIEADPALMEEALVNILLNARQSISRTGEIEVDAISTDDGRLQIHVVDNGCGIHQEDLPKVLSPFFTRRKGGIGLGLPMAQKTIEAHGGGITIESSTERGTIVTIQLPQSLLSSVGSKEISS